MKDGAKGSLKNWTKGTGPVVYLLWGCHETKFFLSVAVLVNLMTNIADPNPYVVSATLALKALGIASFGPPKPAVFRRASVVRATLENVRVRYGTCNRLGHINNVGTFLCTTEITHGGTEGD